MDSPRSETAESACACGRGPGHIRIKTAGCEPLSRPVPQAEKDVIARPPTFPCCEHCENEPATGKCWAVEVGHGCSCLDCPPTSRPGDTT